MVRQDYKTMARTSCPHRDLREHGHCFNTAKPPTEFLPDRPPANEAVHNVYELKTQPELIRYLHAAAGFPTKPTWPKAIKNNQFASWPGLTVKAATKYFPESEETLKGTRAKN